MTTANLIDYTAAPAQPWSRRPGYLILFIANGVIALLGIPMLVISAKAGGYGVLGAAMIDLGLLGLEAVALTATIIYGVKQSKRFPVRAGRPLTWLFVASGAASASSAAAFVVLCVVPHAAAC